MNNIIATPAVQTVLTQMKAELARLQRETELPCAGAFRRHEGVGAAGIVGVGPRIARIHAENDIRESPRILGRGVNPPITQARW